MLCYFEFEEKRRRAHVDLPKGNDPIVVHLADVDMLEVFPADLYFHTDEDGRVMFEPEDNSNARLMDLQHCLRRRLQELVNR